MKRSDDDARSEPLSAQVNRKEAAVVALVASATGVI